jgi:hypothetical protein
MTTFAATKDAVYKNLRIFGLRFSPEGRLFFEAIIKA